MELVTFSIFVVPLPRRSQQTSGRVVHLMFDLLGRGFRGYAAMR